MAPGRFRKRTAGFKDTMEKVATGIINFFGGKTDEQKQQEKDALAKQQAQVINQEAAQSNQVFQQQKQQAQQMGQLGKPGIRGVGGM